MGRHGLWPLVVVAALLALAAVAVAWYMLVRALACVLAFAAVAVGA
ncbi:MAG: hypothetical protein LKG38_06025 [Atopobiaceae bacterium]|nr:hypothetical protein [Atopobiaceae bacterium]